MALSQEAYVGVHSTSFSPAFHRTDRKLCVCAFRCVLALSLVSLLNRKGNKEGVDISLERHRF